MRARCRARARRAPDRGATCSPPDGRPQVIEPTRLGRRPPKLHVRLRPRRESTTGLPRSQRRVASGERSATPYSSAGGGEAGRVTARKRKRPYTALGTLISERLAVLAKTQQWLADEVGVSKQGLHKWLYGHPETGVLTISRANAATLARVLGVPVEMVHAAAGDASSRMATHAGAPLPLQDAAEWRLIEAYREADERVRLAVRVMLGIDGTDPSSDPRLRRGAAPPGVRSTKHQP